MSTRTVLVALIVLLFAAGGYLYTAHVMARSASDASARAAQQRPASVSAVFACDGGKSIDAEFINVNTSTTTGNSVVLRLSDGRSMTLPQTISADGGRYANSDESVVFWDKGNTAFITENGASTYTSCTAGQ